MRRRLALLTLLTALGVAALPASALAAEEHLYDPVLSLVGACGPGAVSPEDEVEDPGCPDKFPPKRLERPCGTATDRHGYIYVTSPKLVLGSNAGGRIDVFNAQGEFVSEFEHSFAEDQCLLEVDSEGHLYSGGLQSSRVDLFKPSSYPPTASTTYSLFRTFELSRPECGGGLAGAAVDPSNDHLYVGYTCSVIEEYGSAAEGSPPIRELPAPLAAKSIDVYGPSHDVYVLDKVSPSAPTRLSVLDGTDGHVKCELKGDEVPGLPSGIDVSSLGATIAVDQANGDVYLYDIFHGMVYQFAVDGEAECEFDFLGQLPKPPTLTAEAPFGEIAVDSPIEAGEPGYDSPNEGYVYVTSGKNASTSHLFAFRPRESAPPEIDGQEAIEIGETEALLQAKLNPNGLDTTYRFEYTTEAAFDEDGYEGATQVPVPDADAGAGGAFIVASEPIADLKPDTTYRFRLVASNCADPEAEPGECLTIGEGNPGGEGEDANFSTYPHTAEGLPDDRAYELVTPPDTNGRILTVGFLGPHFAHIGFGTLLASPDGESVVFGSNSGALPGLGGGGYRDTYEARRDPEHGWQSRFTGLSAAQATRPDPGGISADHGFSFWSLSDSYGRGSLHDPGPGERATYLRVPPGVEPSPNCAPATEPEGRVEWIACGSLGSYALAPGMFISAGGGHVIFENGVASGAGAGNPPPVQLEPCGPPDGVRSIYDRTPGGGTRCISVPPAGASTEVEEQFQTTWAEYEGANPDGTAVVFKVAGTLYARLDNAETVAVAEGSPVFGGISADGERVFYLKGASAVAEVPEGEILACEVALGPCAGPGAAQEPIQVGSGVEASIVNVSADGSHVYFFSPEQLDGEAGEPGKDNLYVWDGEAIRFVAVLDPLDIDGEGDAYRQGLGLWVTRSLATDPTYETGPADNPSRTTLDGKVFIFLSHANLTGSEGNSHWQLFRYDAEAEASERLRCLSCNPTGTPAGSDARLQTPEEAQILSESPIDSLALIPNLTSDGKRVFFESGERLVAQDLDGKVDVYEWQAQGVANCAREAGCLALISGGRSAADDYLYAMSADGRDVFFMSGDTLVFQDPDATPSIYDARVDGGFPPPVIPPGECLGEACQPAVTAPDLGMIVTSGEKPGNITSTPKRRCPKGKRKVRRAGRTRCVPRNRNKRGQHRRRHHKKDNANRRVGR